MVDFIKPEDIDSAHKDFVESAYNDVIMKMLVTQWSGSGATLFGDEITDEVEKSTGVNMETISYSMQVVNVLVEKYAAAGWDVTVSDWDGTIYFSIAK